MSLQCQIGKIGIANTAIGSSIMKLAIAVFLNNRKDQPLHAKSNYMTALNCSEDIDKEVIEEFIP